MYPKSLSLATKADTKIPLIVPGQGVLLFETTGPCTFFLYSATYGNNLKNGIKVELTKTTVNATSLQTLQPFTDKNASGLSTIAGAYYWFSLDSQNQVLQLGVGEARVETAIYTYTFPEDSTREANKKFLESLTHFEMPTAKPIKLLRDPVTTKVPLNVKDTNELTMTDVATGKFLPSSNLNSMGQKLYNCVSGKRFILDDADFPQFSKAIEYSIATPGLWCNKTLQKKSTEFNKDKPNIEETYLRITLGENSGESPGIPYVMEIWPPGHFSPVHNHAGANAIIRVLCGQIHVKLFPFLSDKAVPFGTADFKKDEITWINPALNQTHQLQNLNKKTTCVTIQCYMYDEGDNYHYDYFDYLDADGKKQQYEPDSDMDFVKFKALMKAEWAAKPWCS